MTTPAASWFHRRSVSAIPLWVVPSFIFIHDLWDRGGPIPKNETHKEQHRLVPSQDPPPQNNNTHHTTQPHLVNVDATRGFYLECSTEASWGLCACIAQLVSHGRCAEPLSALRANTCVVPVPLKKCIGFVQQIHGDARQ